MVNYRLKGLKMKELKSDIVVMSKHIFPRGTPGKVPFVDSQQRKVN